MTRERAQKTEGNNLVNNRWVIADGSSPRRIHYLLAVSFGSDIVAAVVVGKQQNEYINHDAKKTEWDGW